jgi:hypothetical protein
MLFQQPSLNLLIKLQAKFPAHGLTHKLAALLSINLSASKYKAILPWIPKEERLE